MADEADFNPYAPPAESDTLPAVDEAPKSKLPGWVVMFFGFTSLLLPLALTDDNQVTQISNGVNAVLYGLPGAIATLVFGARNVSRGVDVITSVLGCLLAVAGLISALYLIFRAFS
ncbi:MAG: hypothetical protein KC620_22255 [Myxococcales bacterium]|nr:hypothetical protein [Myxococcales bacterium]